VKCKRGDWEKIVAGRKQRREDLQRQAGRGKQTAGISAVQMFCSRLPHGCPRINAGQHQGGKKGAGAQWAEVGLPGQLLQPKKRATA